MHSFETCVVLMTHLVAQRKTGLAEQPQGGPPKLYKDVKNFMDTYPARLTNWRLMPNEDPSLGCLSFPGYVYSLDWSLSLKHWNGALEWSTGVEYWSGLLE